MCSQTRTTIASRTSRSRPRHAHNHGETVGTPNTKS
uniref:Uncharacterized protein n=1 Tax=Rhizophora mucronata TaxID=61149 RepID=A0A2P2N6J0_RHIMU